MSALKPRKTFPSHLQFTDFFHSLLPPHPRDVALIYHTPRHASYNPTAAPVQDVILSITPTPGIYGKLEDLASVSWPIRPTSFLHRPFDLDRRSVPRGSLILASHKRFDELLTVGWNVPLAVRLGLDTDTAVCIKGYKGDPDRRIGLVARLRARKSHTPHSFCDAVTEQFGVGDIYPEQLRDGSDSTQVDAVAIMNAFGPDEVARVIESAIEAGFISGEQGYTRLLYLTGEPKELGVGALRDTYHGMRAVCVGHRAAEEWGIHFLAASIEQKWPDVRVHIVLEEEEPPKRKDGKPDTASEASTKANNEGKGNVEAGSEDRSRT